MAKSRLGWGFRFKEFNAIIYCSVLQCLLHNQNVEHNVASEEVDNWSKAVKI